MKRTLIALAGLAESAGWRLRHHRFLALAGLGFALAGAGMPTRPVPILPDPKLTPGDTLAVTAKDICVPGYSKKVRDVPQAIKNLAYRRYGIVSRQPGEFEVDHLISLELGGSNSIKNLWPESFITQPWNAHKKDALENRLHSLVCTGKIPLTEAQTAIRTNWIKAYAKYMPTSRTKR